MEESDFSRALVHFIAACGDSKACWYSLKHISNDVPYLPEAMGLTYSSMMYMFQCSGLASKRADAEEWNFLPKKFMSFASQNDLQKVTDIISSKLSVLDDQDNQVKRKNCWFLRLGGLDATKVRFAGYPTTAPRISGIDRIRATFHNTLWELGKRYQKVEDMQASYTSFQKSTRMSFMNSTTKANRLNHDPGLVVSDGSVLATVGNKEDQSAAMTSTPTSTPVTLASAEDPPSNVGGASVRPSILLNHIRIHLMPLLLQEQAINRMDDFFLKNINETAIEHALLSIVGCIQEEKEKRLSNILQTDQLKLSPSTITNTSKFPKLRQYGIPIDDQRVHQSLLRDLYFVHKRSSVGQGSSILSTPLPSGEQRALILIPQAKTYKNLIRSEKDGHWFSDLMRIIGGGGTGEVSEMRAIQFVCHFLSRNHQEEFIEAVKLTGTQLIEPLDPIATFALQSVCNIPGSKMKLLKRFLESEVGLKIFSSPTEIKKVIGMDSVVPITGTFNYAGSSRVVDPRSKESIPFMYKSAKDIVRLLVRMQVREKNNRFGWNHLDISTCIDHGKGFMRATLICVLRQIDESGSYALQEEQHSFSVGNAQCAKDNVDIVKGTFGTRLNEEMKSIRDAKKLRIWLAKGANGVPDGSNEMATVGSKKWEDAIVTIGEHEESEELYATNELFAEFPIELWIAGDLKWIAAAFGKENSSGHWCPWCLRGAREWRMPPGNDNLVGDNGLTGGPFWSLELLREYAEGVRDGKLKTSAQRKGVVAETAIDYDGPDRIIFPVLHATLGFGNDWLKSFIREMQAASEAYSAEYLEAEEGLGNASEALDIAIRKLREYKAQVREPLKEGRKALRRSGRNALGQVQHDVVRSEVEQIEGEIDKLQEEVDSSKVAKEMAREVFEREASKDENSKAFGQPVRKKIEEILKKHGIDKGAAFGGDLQGNACRKLMEKASTIVDEVKVFMCLPETAATRVIGTDDEIRERCDLYCQLLVAFDGCLSGLRTKRFRVTEEIIETTEKFVKRAMELCRHLGFSITPKLHCLESHSVYLLRKHRGFADLGEDAGERAHQTEFRKDSRLAAQTRSHDRREAAKAINEAKECDPRVQHKVRQMYDKTRNIRGAEKRKAAVEANREEKKQAKRLKREAVLESQEGSQGRANKFSDQRVAKFRPREGGMNSNI